MAIPVVYKSTDGNAPVLCGTRTSMVNVLQKCLVDGYGEKPPAGWTMPYINIDKTKACFRGNPANGTGFYLMVDGVTPTSQKYIILYGCESISVDPELVEYFKFGSSWIIDNTISTTADGAARPWICIATDTWLYFFSYRNVTAFPTSQQVRDDYTNSVGINFFFGDFDKLSPDDAFNCVLFLGYSGSDSFGYAISQNDIKIWDHYAARSSTGVSGALPCGVSISPPGPHGSWFGGKGAPYSDLSALLVSKLYVNNGAANTLRGFMPNAVAPLHSFPFANLAIIPSPDGNDYLAVSFRSKLGSWGVGTSSQILINIGPTP